jgi:hypothetical protein
MPQWPKTIYVKGIGISIESWDDFDELVARYGAEGPVVIGQSEPTEKKPRDRTESSSLSPHDKALLEQLVQAGSRGVPTKVLGPAVGRSGKGIRIGLDFWSRKIGLVDTTAASPFDAVKGAKGRGFRLNDLALQTGRTMLGK